MLPPSREESERAQPPDAQSELKLGAPVSHESGEPVAFSLEPFAGFDPSSIVAEPVEPVDGLFGRFGARCLALRGVLTLDECRYLVQEMGAGDVEPVAYRKDYRRNDRRVFESHELSGILWERVQPFAEALALAADPSDASRQGPLAAQGGVEEGEEREAAMAECPEELRLQLGCAGVWRPIGLNECLRFCRYHPGGFFRAHCDAVFKRSDDEMSLFTCMFYLDGDMSGGATRFLRIDEALTADNYLKLAPDDSVLASLAPQPGLCLLFFQPGLLHEGEDLRSGIKHILRTEVMFRRDPGTGPQRTPQQEQAWRLAQEAQEAEAAGDCDRACALYRRAFKLDPRLERLF